MDKKFKLVEWYNIFENTAYTPIKYICDQLLKSEIPFWRDRQINNKQFHSNQINIVKGHLINSRLRNKHTVVFNGTPNYILLPSLLSISFHKNKKSIYSPSVLEYPPCSVIATWSLDTKFVINDTYLHMLNAKKVFTVRDEAILLEMKNHTDVEKKVIEHNLSEYVIFRQFLFLLGNMFKDMFKIPDIKVTTPVLPAYAEKVYECLKLLYNIQITPINKLTTYNPTIVVSRTKETTPISNFNCSTTNQCNRKCVCCRCAATTIQYHDFVYKKYRPYVYGYLTPMVIASAYHTAFQLLYEDTKDTILSTQNNDLEIDEEDVVTEW